MLIDPALRLAVVSHGWEKVTFIVDSGASETVMPLKVCTSAPIVRTPKVGTPYVVADGAEIYNQGERVCHMKIAEGATGGMTMAFQVVDVSQALLSLYRVCEQGHSVVFSKKKGSYILVDGDPGNMIPLRLAGGTYELDVWLRPASGDAEAGFARPDQAR